MVCYRLTNYKTLWQQLLGFCAHGQYREANLRQNAYYHQRNDAAQEREEN
jgi:hypothetical protein